MPCTYVYGVRMVATMRQMTRELRRLECETVRELTYDDAKKERAETREIARLETMKYRGPHTLYVQAPGKPIFTTSSSREHLAKCVRVEGKEMNRYYSESKFPESPRRITVEKPNVSK